MEEYPSTRVDTFTETYTVSSVVHIPVTKTTEVWTPTTECSTSTSTCYDTQTYTTWVPSVCTRTSSYPTPVVHTHVTSYASDSCYVTSYPSTVTSCSEYLSYSTCVEQIPTTSTQIITTTSCVCVHGNDC